MRYTLNITYPTGFRPWVYDTSAQAHDAARLIDHHSEVSIKFSVTPVLDRLCGWLPDDAEHDLLRACLSRGNKVAAIRFARSRTGCCLKEAKDWIDTQMADAYVPGIWTADPTRPATD